jgi:chromatin remodeling complex protein RSC6
MAKQTKATKTTDTPVTAPVVNTASAPTPVVAEQSKPKKAPKVKAEQLVAPVTPSTVQQTTTSEETVAEPEVSELDAQSNEFVNKLNQLGTLIASLKNEYKNLKTKWSRELKTAQKTSSKKKRKTGTRAPSGFTKPSNISDELASFLGKDKGTEMARTDVTREINNYIRAHNLQDKENGRKIIPDAKLQTLLKLKKTDELTYFNLQKYMSPHFPKVNNPTATTA